MPNTDSIDVEARPFLKWAGGKTQLQDAIDERLPGHIKESGRIERYVEPLVGAGTYIDDRTFVYFDPPYRPLNATSSFTGYFKDDFDDDDQRKLGAFFKEMDDRGADLLLSNSDPQNENPEDTFFDDLYEGFEIEPIPAKRFINCDGDKRGAINELLIRNY